MQQIAATGKPYVVVLMNGRPLTIPWLADNAPALLEAWYPGTEGGDAVADVLFGKVDPGGSKSSSKLETNEAAEHCHVLLIRRDELVLQVADRNLGLNPVMTVDGAAVGGEVLDGLNATSSRSPRAFCMPAMFSAPSVPASNLSSDQVS